jgi:Signal transduction histidine kinase
LINTGTEISPDQAARLFKPFSRSSSQKQLEEFSSGLGLSIVKELVNLLGGTISLLSRTGEVCFRLTLPVQQALFDPLAVDKCKSTGFLMSMPNGSNSSGCK